MTGAVILFQRQPAVSRNHSPEVSALSSLRADRAAIRQYRAQFKDRWSKMMTEAFGADHALISGICGAKADTVDGWITGDHAPSGAFVGLFWVKFPDECERYLGRAGQ